MAKKNKTNNFDFEEIKKAISHLIPKEKSGRYNYTYSIHGDERYLTIEHSQMYNHISINFEIMLELSKIFGTTKIDIRPESYSAGCETCDFGSEYFTNIYIRNCDLSKWRISE